MLQEATYNGHTYKVGEFVYFIEEDTDYSCAYFGVIKSIKPFKNLLNENDNQYIIETQYTEYGLKFPEPFEKLTINCYIRPAKESLNMLIKDKQDEIKSLKEIYKEIE